MVSIGDIIENNNKNISIVLGFTILTKNNPHYKSDDTEVSKVKKKQQYTLYKQFQLSDIKYDNITKQWYFSKAYSIDEDQIQCSNIIRISSWKELTLKYNPINLVHLYDKQNNNFNVQTETIHKITEHLEKIYNELNPFNKNRIPINVILFVDKFHQGNLSTVSYGTLRMRFLDLPSVVQNLLENLPIITIYPKSLDGIGIMKMFDQIFTEVINNVININGQKYTLHIYSVAADTIERYNVCGNIRANSSSMICPVCDIENNFFTELRSHVTENIIEESDDYKSGQNVDTTIWNNIFCSYNCDKWSYRALYQKLENKFDIMKNYSYETHQCHSITQHFTQTLSRLIGVEYYHSFGNAATHLINDIMSLMSVDELAHFKRFISFVTCIRIDMINAKKLVNMPHYMKLSLIWKLSFALIPTLLIHSDSLLKPYLKKLEYIVIYFLIYAFENDPLKQFNIYEMTTNVCQYIVEISEYCRKHTKKTDITNITLHQITGLCLSSLFLFNNIQHLTTNMFECGMKQLKVYLKKCLYNVNRTMIAIIHKRNITFLLRGFKFSSVNGKYIFNIINGTYQIKSKIYDIKETLLFTRMHHKLVKDHISYIPIPSKKNVQKLNVHIPFWTNIDEKQDISFDSKIFSNIKNEWVVEHFYALNLTDIGNVYAELKSIYKNKHNKYCGHFQLLKMVKKQFQNGYCLYIKDEKTTKVQLTDYPLQVFMIKINMNDQIYYLLHPMFIYKRKNHLFITYIKTIIQFLNETIQ